MLEIMEYWFVHENGKQQVRKKRNITTWTDKDDLFAELMKWVEAKEHNLDDDLVFAARTISQSDGMSNWDKLVRVAALINRFSKFAAENNVKKPHNSARTTWAEIYSMESKLRGSVFE